MAIASGEHLQLAASKNLIANAGNHADIGVVKNMFIGVGQALSVFVRKAGIKLFANKGAISVQAQNDLMELLAQKSIVITSTEDEIKITAKKKITLNGGGSYIRLDACGIEAGTPGEYNVKAGYYGRKPKAKLTPELMAFPVIESGEFNAKFLLLMMMVYLMPTQNILHVFLMALKKKVLLMRMGIQKILILIPNKQLMSDY